MNNKLSPFQLILFVVLIIIILIAVAMFAFQRAKSKETSAPVTMWGTIDAGIMRSLSIELNEKRKVPLNVIYTQKNLETYEAEMIEALAIGTAPDLFLLPDELFLKQQNKLFKIPYVNYPQRDFKENFIEGAEILLTKDGIWGLPFTIDPLVLYWNRNKLNSAGIAKSPEYWDDFLNLVPKLVVRDSSLNIQDSAVALGEYQNIRNAKDIFVTLLMQAGNPVVSLITDQLGEEVYVSTLGERFGFSVSPTEAALSFFTQFSNPTKDVYSWNRSLPYSDEMFLANDLAFYLGFASERENFLQKNPNLNFDISVVPQSKSSQTKKTIANFHFVTISRNASNLVNAFNTAKTLTDQGAQEALSQLTGLPPVNRNLLSRQQDNSVRDVFYQSALISKIFLDPNQGETTKIFSEMIESFTSGRSSVSQSVDRASTLMSNLIK